MKLHVCWTIDCESTQPGIEDPALGRSALSGFSGILEAEGWRGTFFLIRSELEPLGDLLAEKAGAGHELGVHTHPDACGYPSPYLGTYGAGTQREIIEGTIDVFDGIVGMRPVSCRPGFASANDHTFPVLAACGIRQTSASMPGRKMTKLASNWAGAPLFTHYAHPHNRFLVGGLDLVEIPISVDWETMIWGGLHPQDLRIEYTDAKNHSFAIEKIMRRQVAEDLPLKALTILTHNLYRYDDSSNFRRQTMMGMIETIRRCAADLGLEVEGSTIAEAAADYRRAVPFEGESGACSST